MVGAHGLFPESLGEQVRDALCHPAGVDEDERRAVALDQLPDHSHRLLQLLGGHHRAELVRGEADLDVERAPVTDVDDRAARRAVGGAPPRRRPHEQARHGLDRPLRRGEADAHGSPPPAVGDEAVEPLEGEREVCTPFVAGDGVDLVDDHGVDRGEQLPAACRRRQ